MKSIKTILTGAIALTLASQAFADVTVYITGSSAYRAQINVSIAKVLGVSADGTNIQAAYDPGTNSATLASSNKAVFKGPGTTLGVPGTVTIKTSWSGSAAGIQAVTQPVATSFLADSVTTANATTTGGQTAVSGGQSVASPATENVNPEIVLSDVDQVATPFTTGNALDKDTIGIVDFVWCASKAATTTAPFTGINNITPQLAQALYGGTGKLAVSLFTGNPADSSTFVYGIGRNPDSGTRLTAFAESGVGLFSTVQQWSPAITSGNVTALTLWPQETVNGILFSTGNSGYSSGGNLRTALQATTGSVGSGVGSTALIGYLSNADARSAITGGTIKELAYNGVTYGGNTNLIKEGQYTFWSYEWFMFLQSLTGDKATVATSLRNQAKTDAPIKLTDMHVSRQTDGGVVTP